MDIDVVSVSLCFVVLFFAWISNSDDDARDNCIVGRFLYRGVSRKWGFWPDGKSLRE